MKGWVPLFPFLLFLVIGCDNKPLAEKENPKVKEIVKVSLPEQTNSIANTRKEVVQEEIKEFKPFYVYSEKGSRRNHYVASGFMPDGNCVELNDKWTEDCYSGQTCIKIDYNLECSREGKEWAGIYWLNPANNWGQRKGGYNLEGAQKLTFWAKGEVGGEQINEVTIGGITGEYPDSDMAVIGPIILMPTWKQYTIDLRGKDLSYISAGFAWSTSAEVNYESCTFYLDDIRFE